MQLADSSAPLHQKSKALRLSEQQQEGAQPAARPGTWLPACLLSGCAAKDWHMTQSISPFYHV